jgi:hypothetical protein
MTIKVGVLSDTHLHGATPALRRIYDRHLSGLSVLLHAGDVVSTEVVRFLEQGPFFGVHGNMDPPDLRERLPSERIVELNGFRIGLTHGRGSPSTCEEEAARRFSGVDVVVYGHTHIPANRVLGGVLLFNPGTLTGHSRSGTNTFGILELDETLQGRIVEIEGDR